MHRYVQSAIGMIEEQQGAIKLQAIAHSLNLSVSHLSNLFRTTLGMSPTRFIQQVRQARARTMLLESPLSVKEIAALVGFRDKSHFNREFKKHFGDTPKGLRHAHLLSKKAPAANAACLESGVNDQCEICQERGT